MLQTPDPFAEATIRAALGTRFSAAVLRVTRDGGLVYERAYGTVRSDSTTAVAVDTRFDLASLTKVVLSTVSLDLVARGALALDAPLLPFVPEWRGTDHAPITLREVLSHTAGFASGADYRTLLDQRVETFAATRPLVHAPGTQVLYSDLGFITLGLVLERVVGRGLRAVVAQGLAAHDVPSLDYRPSVYERAMIPATERDPWRGLVQGTVHDEKAHLMNGISAHAGLFGNARDVARIADTYLLRSEPIYVEAVRIQAHDAQIDRGLGWALKQSDANSCGTRMGPRTYGHTGFTGTCVWTDPGRRATVVLLTNAVHFGRGDLRDVRADVCDRVMETLDACA